MTPQYPDSSYAFWTDPQTGFTATYNLALFKDIAAAVETGFKKIKYGGIEVGGVLLGVPTENGVRIESYRPIACQYAFGPRFILSEPDVEGLKSTLETLAADEQVQPIGLYVGHTRVPQLLTGAEAGLFDEFFSGEGKLVLLVKPDLVEPPLFSFLTRGANGEVARDGRPIAVRVPVPEEGTVASAAEPLPSIAAPLEVEAEVEIPVAEEVREPEPELEPELEDFTPEEPALEEELVEEPEPEPEDFEVVEAEVVEIEYVEPEVAEEAELPTEPAPEPEPEPEQPVEIEPEKVEPEPVSVSPEPEPPTEAPKVEEATPKPAAEAKPEEKPKEPEAEPQAAREKVPPAEKPGFVFTPVGLEEEKDVREAAATKSFQLSKWRWAAVIAVAVLLGASAGYWIYSQLPPTTIPLRAQAQPPILTISWPAESTRDAVWAGIRIDNGQPIPLSTADKQNGQAQINVPSDNVKIELIAQHWIRDSHGIVRFINGMPPRPVASAGH